MNERHRKWKDSSLSLSLVHTQRNSNSHTHSHISKSATCQAVGQLFKQLIRSVSYFGPVGGGLCKMVRPDTVTSWWLVWESQAGIGPKPTGWVTWASDGLMIEILSISYRPSGLLAMCCCDSILYRYWTTQNKVLLNSWSGFNLSPSRLTLESTIDLI